MAVSVPGRRTRPSRRGYVIPPDLFALWMARRGLRAGELRRFGLSSMTLSRLAAGKPVDVSTIRKLDAVAQTTPVLSIANELLPSLAVGADQLEVALK